jgi:virulence factor Mce-like protein
MRRIALSALILAACAAGLVLLTGASNGTGGTYKVRAIFDNASAVVQGEDVRIAGAPVGTITGLDVCLKESAGCPSGSLKTAAVTLEVDKAGFTPFHANATCAIRPQSLIGEKYVDCNPGTSSAPALQRIRSGPGSGSYLLPVTNTSSPVETDIVQDIYRAPVREQLAIILNELGTGLASRGADLNAVIHRANPALGYTDQVIQILARQNHQLAQLATDSARVLGPLAKDKRQIADFVNQANTTSVASAARAADTARSFQLLPSFLRQLRPLMADLGSLADQGTPLSASLSQAAPALAAQYQNLAPFAGVARKSLIDLGNSASQQQANLIATIPLSRRLQRLGDATVPSATLLDKLTASIDKTGGIQQLMALLFYGTQATNGFDSAGHYVRDQPLVGSCTGYAKTQVPSCGATFSQPSAAADVKGHVSRASARALATLHRAWSSGVQSAHTVVLTGLLRYLIGSPS